MISLIKNCEVYNPKFMGKKDVLICNNKIEGIYDKFEYIKCGLNINVINGEDKLLFPGFIDAHVHIIGGGGEDGYTTRTPELKLSQLTKSGITTVVGCLGTDNISRNMNTLIAKAKALKKEGINAFCYTGSYEIPVKTATGTIKSDLILIEEIIGTGEIALSDHRSSQPTYDEFARVVSESRVGGLLSGKCGIVNVHIGGGHRKLEFLLRLIDKTEIPPTQLLPTHINRNNYLFEEGLKYVGKGGYIDLTTSCDLQHMEHGELRAGDALAIIVDKGININNITFTSDGNGSIPNFDKDGNLIGFGICSVESLYEEVKYSIKEGNVPIEKALQVITSNVAERLLLNTKGKIIEGYDADLVMVNKETLEIESVFAKGKLMVENKKVIVKGFFE